ncbi:MAG: acyl transferase [Bacteroidia bacterium]|nr:acyl transferase [Bacteroidia bacterium]
MTQSILSASDTRFKARALEVFHYQYERNPVYRDFVNRYNPNPPLFSSLTDIPFLPISLFKTKQVTCFPGGKHDLEFLSSGTGTEGRSRHLVRHAALYRTSILEGFRSFYGDPEDYIFLFLLPSWHERKDSSLVYMMRVLMESAPDPNHGFFGDNTDDLIRHIRDYRGGKKLFLTGVTYALLDLAEKNIRLPSDAVLVETGGMKGKRRELIREEVHMLLQQGTGLPSIHSEYGMTELLSQAWSQGSGIFHCPPSMKVLIRDPEDPGHFHTDHRSGNILVIDLNNRDSCSFIATEDIGKHTSGGGFEVLGRMDHAELRGCNLMMGGQDTTSR